MNDMSRHNIYTIPEGFLDSFDGQVLSAASRRRLPRMSAISRISLAAAVVVCALTGTVVYLLSIPGLSEHHVTQAFCNLSEADREFLMETDENDIFLNL